MKNKSNEGMADFHKVIENIWSKDYIELANGWKLPYDELLHLYGPEGLYEIAQRLREIADDDVFNSTINNEK